MSQKKDKTSKFEVAMLLVFSSIIVFTVVMGVDVGIENNMLAPVLAIMGAVIALFPLSLIASALDLKKHRAKNLLENNLAIKNAETRFKEELKDPLFVLEHPTFVYNLNNTIATPKGLSEDPVPVVEIFEMWDNWFTINNQGSRIGKRDGSLSLKAAEEISESSKVAIRNHLYMMRQKPEDIDTVNYNVVNPPEIVVSESLKAAELLYEGLKEKDPAKRKKTIEEVIEIAKNLELHGVTIEKLKELSVANRTEINEYLGISKTVHKDGIKDEENSHKARKVRIRTKREANLAVSAIKVSVGEMRADICWVIDNPAFFDTNSSVSDKFFQLLAQWDEFLYMSDTTDEEFSELSIKIEKEFMEAKLKATMIGLGYFHGETKKQATIASKLAHKAMSTDSLKERSALMSKAAKILSETMSIMLPTETKKAIASSILTELPVSFKLEDEVTEKTLN